MKNCELRVEKIEKYPLIIVMGIMGGKLKPLEWRFAKCIYAFSSEWNKAKFRIYQEAYAIGFRESKENIFITLLDFELDVHIKLFKIHT